MGTFRPWRSPPPALPASPSTQTGMGRGPPPELGPIHGHVPSWTPGPRANGEGGGKIPSEPWRSQPLLPMGQRPTPQRKVRLHPPHRQRGGLSLKGHEPTTPTPTTRPCWLQSTSREGASPEGPQAGSAHLQPPSSSIITHRPGRGSERASYPPQITQPGAE